jgi:4-hydroxy-3-polyprenylbenzoate decarboxylase
MPGVVTLQTKKFTGYPEENDRMRILEAQLSPSINNISGVAMIVICDDSDFTAQNLRNFLWVTFTRCNPSHDIYGIRSSTLNKHWGCQGPLVIDARIKPHHAPVLETDPAIEKNIDRLFVKGGSLEGIG